MPRTCASSGIVENTIHAYIWENWSQASHNQPQPTPKADGYGLKCSGELSSWGVGMGLAGLLSRHLGGSWGTCPAGCFPSGKRAVWARFWGTQSAGGGNTMVCVGAGGRGCVWWWWGCLCVFFFPFALFTLSQLLSQNNLSTRVLSGFATMNCFAKSRRFARNLNFVELCEKVKHFTEFWPHPHCTPRLCLVLKCLFYQEMK